ncbi:MAG TPA: hypothetical protein VMI11_10625 [Actinomycetes bacterium]|nr:hypothetical protein [Actinomycetes bacterium]
MSIRAWILVAATAVGLALAVSPAAAQQPPPSSPQDEGNEPNITYRDASGDVHVVRFVDWRIEDIRLNAGDHDISSPGWPKATGTPYGYSSAIDPTKPEEHVVYRAANGHVIELWKQDYAETTWHKTDLTSAAGTKARSAGDPLGWSYDTLGRQWVVYRATNGHLHGLTWTRAGDHWKDLDLTRAARTRVKASADPTEFVDSTGATPRAVLVYRGTDRHVHLLAWTVGGAWTAWHDSDVSALAHWTGKPYGRPYGWASEPSATTHAVLNVTVRTVTGHVEQLFGGHGQAWRRHDLTIASGATVRAVSDVQGTVGQDTSFGYAALVQYVGADKHLYRMVLPADLTGHPNNRALFAASRAGLWFQDGRSGYTSFLVGRHLWVSQDEWDQGVTQALDLSAGYGPPSYPYPAPGTGTGGYFTPEP